MLTIDNNLTESCETVTVTSPTASITSITDTLNNISVSSPYTVTGAIGTSVNTNFPNAIWTGMGSTSAPWLSTNPTGTAPKITLNGEGADVEVNGYSLVGAIKRIEERLGLLQPNPKLEAEWEELKALGDKYREMEQHIKDKMRTWEVLNRPAP